jgi:hypothetical protein
MLLLATILAIPSGGCATAINTQDAALCKPFGGVTMPLTDFFGGSMSDAVALLFWPIWLVDKPLSLVGDTLTLPYTLWVQRDAGSDSTGQGADHEPTNRPAGTPGR